MEKFRKNFDLLCKKFGFTTTAAITVFMKTGIPFEIKADSCNEINANGWDAIMQLGQHAKDVGIQDMSLEEINAIIKEVRDVK